MPQNKTLDSFESPTNLSKKSSMLLMLGPFRRLSPVWPATETSTSFNLAGYCVFQQMNSRQLSVLCSGFEQGSGSGSVVDYSAYSFYAAFWYLVFSPCWLFSLRLYLLLSL